MKVSLENGVLNILSEEDVQRIHIAALEILENLGVLSESDLILDLFSKNGAHVNMDTRIIRVPREMVESALKTTPRSFTLYGREASRDLTIESGQVYYGMGGTSEPFLWDYDIGKPRNPTKADMIRNTQVGHALPHISFVMTLCSAGDVPKELIFFHDYDAIFRNTTKPTVVSVIERHHTARILEMAAAASGGEGEFRQRPSVLAIVTPVSPLVFATLNEGLIDAVEFNVPILYSPGPMMGLTGPATVAGTLALSIAESLFGLVLTQVIKPGAPFIFNPYMNSTEMTTGQCTYGSPEQSLGRSAMAQMSRYYGLPTFTDGGGVEAKLPDAEAAAEAMMGMLLNGLGRITLTQSMGTLASGLYGAPEMLVICNEMVHMIERVLAGVQVNDDTLALNVIRDVGYGGNFLRHHHTREYFRKELFFPELFQRQTIGGWLESGGRSITDVAHERVEEILLNAQPVALPQGADQELERALKKAIAETKAEEAKSRN